MKGGTSHIGHAMSFSGQDYNIVSYGLNDEGFIDYDQVRELAHAHHPKMIIAGASAYSREINYMEFRTIADEVGAYLMVDMAHTAGLIAARILDNPVPIADVVTSTVHKTMRRTSWGIHTYK